MPSSETTDEETKPTKANNPTTPRRASAVKRTPNGTPYRKISATKPRTPASAPIRNRPPSKKAEPTLLSDFLLGRPSPARTRRKSIDVVKAEMKESLVNKVQPPGGVKDRVKQWQKASAAAAIVDPDAATSEPDEILVQVEESSVDEEDRQRIKFSQTRPGRRKSKDGLNGAESKPRSKSAPRKRVISDDHWMLKKKRSPPRKSPSGGAPIPKNFLAATAVNPPVGKKIEDWVKRMDMSSPELEIKPRTRKASEKEVVPELPGESTVSAPSRITSIDDGVRTKPSMENGFRNKSSRDGSLNDNNRVKAVRKESSKIRIREDASGGEQTPRQKSEQFLKPPPKDLGHRRRSENSNTGSHLTEDESITTMTNVASPTDATKRRQRKSTTPPESVADNPFGSVVDLPVGAEAGNMRRLKPQRNPSLSVPKVLKRVYNEGLKIVHDTAEPPRGGLNQPPSIESWLNNTTDPFVDHPSEVGLAPEISEPSRRSYKEGDHFKQDLTAAHDGQRTRTASKRKSSGPVSDKQEATKPMAKDSFGPPLERDVESSKADKVESVSPQSTPNGLRRSPATRAASSPVKTGRKMPFKEVVFDAFRGESSVERPKKASSPPPDVSGLQERDANRSPVDYRHSGRNSWSISLESNLKHDPRAAEDMKPEEPKRPRSSSYQSLGKRQGLTTGGHRLSTIASVETFSTSSSTIETISDMSRTTLTQATSRTGHSASNLSRSKVSRKESAAKPGLKRRLTKHSDLVSMLSLPDTAPPGRSKSIRSARSVRTTRTPLDRATVQDLMRELADDEVKYMRELKTLVDGVIPVLLTSVLSKSDSAITAGLFVQNSTDPANTKPIVDIGVNLERLKSLHKRIPLKDPEALISWLYSVHSIYADYIRTWRLGFQDIVVNLAPASRSASAEQVTPLDEIPRNAQGDVINSNGERVDVAYLLKRPLLRVKYLLKILKGLERLLGSESIKNLLAIYQDLQNKTWSRLKEEAARFEDNLANNIDTTKARNLRTMALVEEVQIDRTRQVYAKDFFLFERNQSNGERFECKVEMIIRDKQSDKDDYGDVLICAVDGLKGYLLFPPITRNNISARLGDKMGQVVVMVRNASTYSEFDDAFLLSADNNGVAKEWVEMLTVNTKMSPMTIRYKLPDYTSAPAVAVVKSNDVEVPIGESRYKELPSYSEEAKQAKAFYDSTKEPDDPPIAKRARASRYHTQSQSSPTERGKGNKINEPIDKSQQDESKGRRLSVPTMELPFIPKLRPSSLPSTPESLKAKESLQPTGEIIKKRQSLTPDSKSARDDGAPPPPLHHTPSPKILKNGIPLDTPTPKARRSSSPLKHEYHPSDVSDDSSTEPSDSEYDSSESSDDELEAADLPEMHAGISIKGKVSSADYSLSLSQTRLDRPSTAPKEQLPPISEGHPPAAIQKLSAKISCWNDKKGRWDDLHSEPCSIVVSPGKVHVFEMTAAQSDKSANELAQNDDGMSNPQPLIVQELTPLVALRQSNFIDIEIPSQPTPESRLKSSRTVRYRSANIVESNNLYLAIHKARMQNQRFLELERLHTFESYGRHPSYEAAVAKGRRRSFWGRLGGYRAPERAESSNGSPPESSAASSSRESAFTRLTKSRLFNIGKSSVESSSRPVSSFGSASDSLTPPQTPPSLMGTTASDQPFQFSSENIKVKLHGLETPSKWLDHGSVRLTVTQPSPGMKSASSLWHGIERRIIVTRNPMDKIDDSKPNHAILDVVLGRDCFSRIGRTGICVNIWEEMRGEDGVVGRAPAVGGVSSRTRKWCFQCGSGAEANWVYSLLAIGR